MNDAFRGAGIAATRGEKNRTDRSETSFDIRRVFDAVTSAQLCLTRFAVPDGPQRSDTPDRPHRAVGAQ